MDRTEKKKKLIINVLFVAAIVAIVYVTLKYLLLWLLPFVIGAVIAICLQRPVAFLTRKTKIGRTFWSILLVFLVLAALIGLIVLIVWQIIQEAGGFAQWVQSLIPNIKSTVNEITVWIVKITERLPIDIEGAIENIPQNLLDAATSGFAGFAIAFVKTMVNVGPGFLISFIFSVVASCYITKDYNKITRFILAQLSDRNKEIVINTKRLFVTNILKVLRGYILIMTITFTELLIGLSILGVEYAPVLAIIIAVLDILPVLGTGTVLLPWGVIALLMGNIYMGVGVLIVYLIITVIRNIIEPKIIGEQVGLPPIVTLLFMYFGLQLFGIFGMLLFPVAVIVIVKLQENGTIHIWNIPEKDSTEKISIFRKFALLFEKKAKNLKKEKVNKDK